MPLDTPVVFFVLNISNSPIPFLLPLFLHISDLDIVTQLLKHLHEHLVHDAIFFVYEPADVRSGSPHHLGKLRLGDAFFQSFDHYIYIKIILYHNASRF